MKITKVKSKDVIDGCGGKGYFVCYCGYCGGELQCEGCEECKPEQHSTNSDAASARLVSDQVTEAE